jgi:hypothetical protein
VLAVLSENLCYKIQGNMNFLLPKMIPARQIFSSQKIDDIPEATRRALSKLQLGTLTGKKIGVTVGSRRISNLAEILATVGEFLRKRKAFPFIIPAMGSHGGAIAEGQVKLLAELGITEESTGMSVESCMTVRQVGTLPDGYPLYYSETAGNADGVILCARVKPHTSIRGVVESGLCKMLVVGLGKHKGATAFHRQGYDHLSNILPQAAHVLLENTNVLCGLGLVENAFDETLRIEAMSASDILEKEEALLMLAKSHMPQFFLDEIDVLVVKKIGKDISGAGMDPNITGRAITPLPMSASTLIRCIVVLDLTSASHGNATGIGGADITTRHVVKKIDFANTYTNVLTSGAFPAARLPMVLNSDEDAVRAAILCAPRERLDDVKIVVISDTLHLSEIFISQNYLPSIQKNPKIVAENECIEMKFTEGHLSAP